jgi:hypothetical protein
VRLARCVVSLPLILFAGAAFAAEDRALEVLEACRAKLDARTDIGLARIEKRCPDLLPALRNAPWSRLLPLERDQRDDISAESLRELAALVGEANRRVTARRAPDVSRLQPVLARLGEQGQQGATRWERFKRWLQDKLERSEQKEDEDSWLEDFGRQFETSEGVARFITYTGYGFMGLLVLFVVWTELRAAGLLGGVRRAAAQEAAGEWRRLQLVDVMAAPLAERPGLLLRLLGEALTRTHLLPAASGLTAGALVRRAQLADEDRAQLEQVAAAAEAVRYAPEPPTPERLEGAVESARSLLAKLARLRPPRGI